MNHLMVGLGARGIARGDAVKERPKLGLILEHIDYGPSGEPMLDRVTPRTKLAGQGPRPGAAAGIEPIGDQLLVTGHWRTALRFDLD